MLLFFHLVSIFKFHEVGGLASLVQARAAVLDIPTYASLNPSLMIHSTKSGLNLTFTQPYGVSGLKYLKGDLAIKRLDLGLGLSSLSRAGYGEYIFSLGKGFSLAKDLSFGALLALYYLSISNYENDFFFSLSPSLSFSRPPFLLSLILLHSNQPKSLYGEELPLTLLFGVNYSVLEGVDFYFDYQREKEELMRGGMRLHSGDFFLGTGFETNPVLFGLGFGISLAKLEVSYALKIHHPLKEYSAINLGVRF